MRQRENYVEEPHKKHYTEEEINELVDDYAQELAEEGLFCDEEEKESARKLLRGETTIEKEMMKLLDKYK